MPFETHIKLLANGDWLEMLLPLLLLLVYGAAAMVKRFLEYSKQKSDESQVSASDSTSAGGLRRYKPIDQSSRPQPRIAKGQALPYARTAAQRSTPVSEPRRGAKAADPQTDWERQKQVEQLRQQQAQQRRLQQVEAQRLKKAQQNQQMQQQQQIQQQAAKSVEAARIAAQRTTALPSRGAAKSPQEALRQVRTGKPSGMAARAAGRKPSEPRPPRPESMSVSTSAGLRKMLATPNSLRTGIVLKELLDRPLGLRDL